MHQNTIYHCQKKNEHDFSFLLEHIIVRLLLLLLFALTILSFEADFAFHLVMECFMCPYRNFESISVYFYFLFSTKKQRSTVYNTSDFRTIHQSCSTEFHTNIFFFKINWEPNAKITYKSNYCECRLKTEEHSKRSERNWLTTVKNRIQIILFYRKLFNLHKKKKR